MFKSKMVPADISTRTNYYYTPGIYWDRAKYWFCRPNNETWNELYESYLKGLKHRWADFEADWLHEHAAEYADRHKDCTKRHQSWRGSISISFPRWSKIDRIKFWYQGNPNKPYGTGKRSKPVEILRRAKCHFCDKVAMRWYSEDFLKDGNIYSRMYSTCDKHWEPKPNRIKRTKDGIL